MNAVCLCCSASCSFTTAVIDLTARWICKRRYRADQSRMASLLVERFSAGFITHTVGLHDQCIFAALQRQRASARRQGFDQLSQEGGASRAPPLKVRASELRPASSGQFVALLCPWSSVPHPEW